MSCNPRQQQQRGGETTRGLCLCWGSNFLTPSQARPPICQPPTAQRGLAGGERARRGNAVSGSSSFVSGKRLSRVDSTSHRSGESAHSPQTPTNSPARQHGARWQPPSVLVKTAPGAQLSERGPRPPSRTAQPPAPSVPSLPSLHLVHLNEAHSWAALCPAVAGWIAVSEVFASCSNCSPSQP